MMDSNIREEEHSSSLIGWEMEEEDYMFENAIQGNWDQVAEAYTRNPNLQAAKLTKAQDTALHLAVSNGQTKAFFDLVRSIGSNHVLHIKNDKGNTPLHLAAATGDVQMCLCLVHHDPSLIKARNLERETPLFVAVRHRNKQAFLCLRFLHTHLSEEAGYVLCRKKNGDTILHSAISAEHFGFACEIIRYYPKLTGYVNELGQSPLHILAGKSNAFKSGSRLRPFDRLIYRFVIVGEHQEESFDPVGYVYKHYSIAQTTPNYPDNYATCMNFFNMIWTSFQVITSRIKKRCIKGNVNDDENPPHVGNHQPKKQKKTTFRPTYATFLQFMSFMIDVMLILLGIGKSNINETRQKKRRHIWANKILNQLVGRPSLHRYRYNGQDPRLAEKVSVSVRHKVTIRQMGHESPPAPAQKFKRTERPILIAARKGVIEVVEKIIDTFPVAVQDLDADNKNVVLLAVEHRQTDVYQMLLKKSMLKDDIFRQVDNQGNSAWHLAAKYGEHKPWLIPGAALQMQWEFKWYHFVKNSMPPHYFATQNSKGKTPKDIFTESHKHLMKEGSAWLKKTAESCSLVAALVATVAFPTSATVPGGLDQGTGLPILGDKTPFNVAAVASLVALSSSVTSLIIFLTIITSSFQEKDFAMNLPRKLFMGFLSLYTSIASMLVSFCAGHVFVLQVDLKYASYPLYGVMCLPVTVFVLAQLSLYFDLARAIFNKEPQRSYKSQVS